MKLLFVAPRYHTNQHPLVKALQSKGHEVRFHVLRVGLYENHSLLTPEVMPTSRLVDSLLDRLQARGGTFDRTPYATPTVGSYFTRLRDYRPDLVVVRDPQRLFSIVALMAARALGVRTVLYTQGAVHERTSAKVAALRSLGARLAGGQWMSPVLGDEDVQRAHPRFHYVPFAADPDTPQKSDWFAGDKVNVLGIGKFFPRKNHLLLVRAVARLRDVAPFTLTIVGEASSEPHRRHLAEVQAYVAERHLGDVVTITSNLPHSAMADVYLAHDLFVLASRDESASVAVLEAMAHGLPVVCSTTNGTRHDVKDGVNGFVFESDDEDDLVAKLSALVADRQRLREMGEASRRIAMTDHHPDLVAERLLALAAA